MDALETETGGGAPSTAGMEPLQAWEGANLAANVGLNAETQSMKEQNRSFMELVGCDVASS